MVGVRVNVRVGVTSRVEIGIGVRDRVRIKTSMVALFSIKP